MKSLGTKLARGMNKGEAMMTNRLDTIATRQRSTRVRDALFASLVALATAISVASIGAAAAAASTQIASR
ncbi:MAG: hypothetical protein ACTHU0_05595 [Kofleriaceae bacterium]